MDRKYISFCEIHGSMDPSDTFVCKELFVNYLMYLYFVFVWFHDLFCHQLMTVTKVNITFLECIVPHMVNGERANKYCGKPRLSSFMYELWIPLTVFYLKYYLWTFWGMIQLLSLLNVNYVFYQLMTVSYKSQYPLEWDA